MNVSRPTKRGEAPRARTGISFAVGRALEHGTFKLQRLLVLFDGLRVPAGEIKRSSRGAPRSQRHRIDLQRTAYFRSGFCMTPQTGQGGAPPLVSKRVARIIFSNRG
jgi:hypothetical protein